MIRRPARKCLHDFLNLLVFLCVLLSHSVFAQQQSVKVANSSCHEKVFLHTDRDAYATGEDIWFKAYLTDAQTGRLSTHSRSLYVEIISPQDQVWQHCLIRLNNGTGNGDFKLQDTLKAGSYRLRAYTNWMRNFGDVFIFEKYFTVISSQETVTTAYTNKRDVLKRATQKSQATPSQINTLIQPSVRFFPEGGSLVEGVVSKIAVKAEDDQGRGISSRGSILANGVAVATFQCDSLGMGLFTLQPQAGQHYEAVAYLKGNRYRCALPAALAVGFVLSTVIDGPVLHANIKCNMAALNRNFNQKLFLKVSRFGQVVYQKEVILNAVSTPIQQTLQLAVSGVVCITLTDANNRPLSERVVYIHQPQRSQTLKINVGTEAQLPHEQVPVVFSLTQPEQAEFSVAVIDAGAVPVPQNNIVAYLNLCSEIKGSIEYPARYFDEANPNRFAQLDQLLLIQGWRDYIWKQLENKPPVNNYVAEQGITLTGRVRRSWRDKPLADMYITLFANKAKGDKLFSAVSDSAGRFSVGEVEFYGYQLLNFTTLNKKGKAGGWIQVDSLYINPPTITPSLFRLPADVLLPATADSVRSRIQQRQKFTLKGNNQLQEVTIKGYSPVLPPEVYAITRKEQKDYSRLAQYLLTKIPGSKIDVAFCDSISPALYTMKGKDWQIVSIRGFYPDKTPVEMSYCGDTPLPISMDRILKLTLNKRQTVDGIVYSVSLLLRPGAFETKTYFSNTTADVNGYYQARVFFATHGQLPDPKTDYCATLHWEPYLKTDTQGKAFFNYYNTGLHSKVYVIAQGITVSGIPVMAAYEYTIK